jgi:hypothetical protein
VREKMERVREEVKKITPLMELKMGNDEDEDPMKSAAPELPSMKGDEAAAKPNLGEPLEAK